MKIPNDSVAPECSHPDCSNVVSKTTKGKWAKHCSPKCRGQHNSLKSREKARQTSIANYGVDNPSKDSSVREKARNTMKERHGVEYSFQSKDLLMKRNETMLEKYGEIHALRIDKFINKSNQTNTERYGNKNVWKSDIANDILEKRKDTCQEKFGVDFPAQSPVVQETRKENTQLKYNKDHTSQLHLSDETMRLMNDYEWLVDQYKTMSVKSISEKLGISPAHLWKKMISLGIKIVRKPCSDFETEVSDFVKSLDVGIIIQNDRTILGGRELDIFVPAKSVAIECNGSYWHSELNGKDKNYHLAKTNVCKDNGIHLIHLWQHEWDNNTQLVKSRLRSKLGCSNRIYARKCVIKGISAEETRTFLSENHIQGYCVDSIRYGLYYNSELVSVMTFGKSRFSKSVGWELLRYCSKVDYTVVGGASRLFKRFVTEFDPDSIISYSDRRWNSGGLYLALGFSYSHSSTPSYHYTSDYNTFENRIAYQKHKLGKRLDNYIETNTEWENMQLHGYDRIWDCGNDVWKYINENTNTRT